jgi:hypothetical protein
VRPAAFSPGQLLTAISLASLVQGGIILAVVLGRSAVSAMPQREPPKMQLAIAVKPVVDMAHVLKKGTKSKAPKLPAMWKPPEPVKRAEPKALPAPEAKKTPPPQPLPKLEKTDEKPPPDTKPQKTEELPPDPPKSILPPVEREGSEDGVEEGKEKDPLKARAVDTYRAKLISWFTRGFALSLAELDCATLAGLSSDVEVRVGQDRAVIRYKAASSGNPSFDERVRRALDAHVGELVPPPPPNYADLLGPTVLLKFSGEIEKCK